MENKPITGILVDLEELKKTPNLVLWGRIVKQDLTLTPYMKLLEVPINWAAVERANGILCDTYFTFE